MTTVWPFTLYKKRVAWRLAHKKSQQIEASLRLDAMKEQQTLLYLLLGRNTGRIMKSLRLFTTGFDEEHRRAYRTTVLHLLLDEMILAIRRLKESCPDDVTALELQDSLLEKAHSLHIEGNSCPSISDAFHQVTNSSIYSKLLAELNPNASQFMNDFKRYLDPTHLPQDNEIMSLPATYHAFPRVPDCLESKNFRMNLRFIDIAPIKTTLKKWIRMFENARCIILPVDLANCDQVDNEVMETPLDAELRWFESIIASRWFMRASCILIFTNYSYLEAKRPSLKPPFSSTENAVTGEPRELLEQIWNKFREVNKLQARLYGYVCELESPADRKIIRFLGETAMQTMEPVPSFGIGPNSMSAASLVFEESFNAKSSA